MVAFANRFCTSINWCADSYRWKLSCSTIYLHVVLIEFIWEEIKYLKPFW